MLQHPSCTKGYTRDLDKAVSPEQTVRHIRSVLARTGHHLLERTRRVDTGRLGIPVYMSICGSKAREIMPTRKQMGKGASAAQAEASALMEFIERYSLFSFLARTGERGKGAQLTWSQAEDRFGPSLIPVQEILGSVQEERPSSEAVQIMDLVPWDFCPASDLHTGQEVVLPLNWFQTINEFNGSSAGNTDVESALQGLCELIERHVCAEINAQCPELPSIDPKTMTDPVLKDLLAAFDRNGIVVWLKDFSLGLDVPTVGVLAYDPATFPHSSEIVFTAGTATSPEKAAIRALTEVAQLGGDFESGSRYEPSGLPKPKTLDQCAWLRRGRAVPITALPDISHPDMGVELSRVAKVLAQHKYPVYIVRTTDPDLQIPAHYSIVPGFGFRERSTHASLGLFVGRILAEQQPEDLAEHGLRVLQDLYPQGHFLPFFQGILALRQERFSQALDAFSRAEDIQPTAQDKAFAAFYQAFCLSREAQWDRIKPHLDRAIQGAPDVHAFYNLRGVGAFKTGRYEQAAEDFRSALELDPGSAMDLVNLGLCLKRAGQIHEALSCLQAGLELDPGMETARAELEELLAGKQDREPG
ncbi:YcaO-like family protein [Desulfovermiculus halophilus]|uniref:YcaO-like family protein n=1 Tax=Desulfovermiculus halophilus TaxID=339722 RepID=UPI00047F8259|nr:YcaO-like family protein [Desulfovermiculus halophilus]